MGPLPAGACSHQQKGGPMALPCSLRDCLFPKEGRKKCKAGRCRRRSASHSVRAAGADVGRAAVPPATGMPPVLGEQSLAGPSPQYTGFLHWWGKGFFTVAEDPEGCWLELVQGVIPLELEGTYFRNGPGKMDIGTQKIGHPYDGDGLVCSIAISQGRAYFRSRFVRTAEYVAEEQAERIMYRGTFATQRSSGSAAAAGSGGWSGLLERLGRQWANALDLYVKNTSNTSVFLWGGALLTTFEASQPYALDPVTLQTRELELLKGQLQPGMAFDLGSRAINKAFGMMMTRGVKGLPSSLLTAGGDAFTAHPHCCAHTGRLVAYTYRMKAKMKADPLDTHLTFREFDADLNPIVSKEYMLEGFSFLHDFVLTEHYYVIFQNPVSVSSTGYMMGTSVSASCVRWEGDKRPMTVHCIPRPGARDWTGRQARTVTVDAPAAFVFHHANAFEEDDGRRIVIDSIHYRSLPAIGKEAETGSGIDPDVAFSSQLRRTVVNLEDSSARISTTMQRAMELPGIDYRRFGRRHRHVYGYTADFDAPSIGLCKVEAATGQANFWFPGERQFCLEPKFIPRTSPSSAQAGSAAAAHAAGPDDGLSSRTEDGLPADDDGWLMTTMYDAGADVSYLLLLDAADLEAGPVATIRLRDSIPHQIHGSWTPDYFGPPQHDAFPAAPGNNSTLRDASQKHPQPQLMQ